MSVFKNYVKDKGQHCINCGSGCLAVGPWDTCEGVASQPVICDNCDAEWTDVYKLVDADDFVFPHDDQDEAEANNEAYRKGEL